MKYYLTSFIVLIIAVPIFAQDPNHDRVRNWYNKYLRRVAADHEVANWVQQDPVQIQVGILGSDEYYQRHGSDLRGQILGLYLDVLNRVPSEAEIASWSNRQFANRQDLVREFLNAADVELRQTTAQTYRTPVQTYRQPVYVPPVPVYTQPVPAVRVYTYPYSPPPVVYPYYTPPAVYTAPYYRPYRYPYYREPYRYPYRYRQY